MNVERLKAILLFFLVVSSLLLTLALWSYQPDFETVENDEGAIDAQLDGKTLTKKEVIKPVHILFHADDQSVGLADKIEEQNLFARILDWSLYNFSPLVMVDEALGNEHDWLEIVFSTDIPNALIFDLFSVDSDADISSGTFDRIYITLEDNGGDKPILFVDSQVGTAVGAQMQNFNQEIQQLVNHAERADLITYEVFTNRQNSTIYLPNDVSMNVLLFSYLQLETDPFRNLLFINPSIVRSSFTTDGNTNYTDGTREMIKESRHLTFTNPTNESITEEDETSNYQLLDQVQQFINSHNGFTFEEPFSYFMSDLSVTSNTNLVEYTLSHFGVPIYNDADITTIKVNWHNQSVYQYTHPLIHLLEQRGVDQVSYSLPSAESVIEILEGENYQGSAIYDVVLGYQAKQQTGGQGQVYELTPTWYVRGARGWQPLMLIEELPGGDVDAMGSN